MSPKNLKSVPLEFWETFPPVYGGGNVVAPVSLRGGTGRTSLCSLLAHSLGTLETPYRCLIVSLSFDYGLQMYFPENKNSPWHSDNLPRTLAKKNTLSVEPLPSFPRQYDKKTVPNMLEAIDRKRYGESCEEDLGWQEFISHVGMVDILFPGYKDPLFGDWEHIRQVIIDAKREYDLIVLDTPAGPLEQWLPVLSMVNFVLVPFRLMDWRIHLNDLRHIDDLVAKLKLWHYPIDIPGIIPVDDTRDIRCKKLVESGVFALQSILGHKRVWPLYQFSPKRNGVFSELRDEKFVMTYSELLDRFHSLVNQRPVNYKAAALKQYKFIWKYVRDNLETADLEDLSYAAIAMKLCQEYKKRFKKNLKRDIVIRALGKTSIFKNQPQHMCVDSFRFSFVLITVIEDGYTNPRTFLANSYLFLSGIYSNIS